MTILRILLTKRSVVCGALATLLAIPLVQRVRVSSKCWRALANVVAQDARHLRCKRYCIRIFQCGCVERNCERFSLFTNGCSGSGKGYIDHHEASSSKINCEHLSSHGASDILSTAICHHSSDVFCSYGCTSSIGCGHVPQSIRSSSISVSNNFSSRICNSQCFTRIFIGLCRHGV